MGQGKSKISDKYGIFNQSPNENNYIDNFSCILIKDEQNLVNKLGKKIKIELDENNIVLKRKDKALIFIEYNYINKWDLNEDDLRWCIFFDKYIKSENSNDSESLDLIEIEDEINSNNKEYHICCKFFSKESMKKLEKSIYIHFGKYLLKNNQITYDDYNQWILKYHK